MAGRILVAVEETQGHPAIPRIPFGEVGNGGEYHRSFVSQSALADGDGIPQPLGAGCCRQYECPSRKRTVETVCDAIGQILGTVTSTECRNYF
uniref:hypothetical protein n=1 Tax=Mesorhizobium mediterraneum TaxID=43617 RepID=UPI001AEE21CA